MFELPNRHFSSREQMQQKIQESINKVNKKTTIVVKGSRSSRMELLVTDLVNGQQQAINGVS